MQVYKPLHHLRVSLKEIGLRVRLGLGLGLCLYLSFLFLSAHFGSACWALNNSPLGHLMFNPWGIVIFFHLLQHIFSLFALVCCTEISASNIFYFKERKGK